MRIELYTAEKNAVWDDFIRNSDNGHFMFFRAYMEYHSDRFQDHSLLVYEENKLRALLPANASDDRLISHQGLSYGGLILNGKTYTQEVGQIIDAIRAYARDTGFKEWYYKAMPGVFQRIARLEDRYHLWVQGAELYRRDISSVIDLRNELKYRSTKKQNIKKGQKAGLEVIELADLTEFWELLSIVLGDRHDAKPTHSYEEIQQLMDTFPKHIKAYGVSHEGQLLGGAVLFVNQKSVHTQYLGVNGSGRDLGALDFLLDGLIRQSVSQGMHYFSFGISTEEQGKVLNRGLIFQKEGFGARPVMHDFFRFEL